MSNSLIPYAFTPGTKAKAQEVNANFIALAEKIEENREFTTTQIAETVEQIEQAASEADEKKVDKNLANTTLITNCIIEAPNGVVEASENVITVKAGLKVFIPDGLNDDGTPKSIEYTVQEDTPVTTVKNSYLNCIYITQTGCSYASAYFQTEQEPYTKLGLWYKASENKMYLYNADSTSWEEIKAFVVASYENTDGIVVLHNSVSPLRLLDMSNKMSLMNLIIPNYNSVVMKEWNIEYTAPKNGWVHAFITSESENWVFFLVNNQSFVMNWVRAGDQASSAVCFPVKRGDVYKGMGIPFSTHHYMYYMPMEGDM